ncbi:unnamed protein product [Alternaria sp. RS040]
MVYSCLTSSTLLRSHQLVVPRTFLRYKSITAAIERGRQGGPDRPFRPRTRTGHNDEGDRPVKTRREARFERFGAPREDPEPASSDRPRASPRSSRFGRIGPSRPRDNDAPSRFRKSSDAHTRSEDTWRERPQEESRFRSSDRRVAPQEQGSDNRPRRPWTNDRRDTRGDRIDEDSSSHVPRTRDSRDDRPRFNQRPDSKGARREGYGRASSDIRPGPRGETEPQKASVRGPESLPYTTAASEFIYGYNSVVSAVKANRRKFYNLYVHSRGASRDGLMSRIRAQKLFSITHEVGDEYMRALDKASSGRPHNGVILEASPLPVPPITELKTVSMEDESFSVTLDSQSAEDVLVNGKQELYSYKSGGWRHPLILYVDGVVDEGNLGAIARSAYVLGADAIITPTHHTANWSHIAVKASAGAAEALPLFKVGDSNDFLKKSANAGWCIYASDAVPPPPSFASSTVDSMEAGANKVVYSISHTRKRLPADHSPVAEHPTILMMGAEGTGLKTSLVNLARYKVGIPHGRESNEVGVDSLNVSVAASILCYEMLQKPKAQPEREPEDVVF